MMASAVPLPAERIDMVIPLVTSLLAALLLTPLAMALARKVGLHDRDTAAADPVSVRVERLPAQVCAKLIAPTMSDRDRR